MLGQGRHFPARLCTCPPRACSSAIPATMENDLWQMLLRRAAEHPDQCVFCSEPKQTTIKVSAYDDRPVTIHLDANDFPMCEGCLEGYERFEGQLVRAGKA